ncbi:MAG: methyltransferase domain-containing protein [Candidatus Omnitrophica bacterium]|nr:methyltransferase domain-containing protein [Candidatus Omnitrophota bacterium]
MPIAARISDANRAKKYRLFMEIFKPDARTTILDVGASENEYQENANIIEKQYLYPENITVLGVDIYRTFIERYPKVKVVTYSGGRFPFDNKTFDIVWCNAVIEHVGGWEKQKGFLAEINRVGKRAFIATPNRLFPLETHTRVPFLHYLPKKIFDRLLVHIGKAWAAGEYMHLLSGSDIKRLLAETGITRYRIKENRIFGLTANFIVIL